ncbi:MAG: aminopeptidase [Deltaproteobacteria bacterium]|nr:aminopeptidase [Deltaproteobacteria bacterium]
MDKAIRDIFEVNLGVRKNERVLVFTDTIRDDEVLSEEERAGRLALKEIAKKVTKIGREFCKVTYMDYPALGTHGMEPPLDIWKSAFAGLITYRMMEIGIIDNIIAKKASEKTISVAEEIIRESKADKIPHGTDCVIALSHFSTTHTRFRALLTDVLGVRYASMPRFEEEMLGGVMTADWNEIAERTEKLVKKLEGSDSVRITTPSGTDITFSIKGRGLKADTGILTERGSCSNLPAGEAFLAPLEGTAEGTLKIHWAPSRKLSSPITLKVEKGMVVDVTGEDEYVQTIKDAIKKNPLAANIAELGIGTNDKATRADNILESEKILGTIHIALGDNSTFGGTVSVPFHQDFVFFEPTLIVEKNGTSLTILKDGELKI